jgi:hypothetical protein
MKASRTRRRASPSEEAVVGDLTSSLASALSDRKSRDWAHAISRPAQRIECFGESKTKRTYHPRGNNRDARSNFFPVRTAWLSHSLKGKIALRISIAFLRETFYK